MKYCGHVDNREACVILTLDIVSFIREACVILTLDIVSFIRV